MIYKAIIADDEKELRTYLKRMLAEIWPQLEICGEAINGKEAMKLIDDFAPHIAFLDIKMPGLSGLDVAKKIAGVCHIVFVTAFDQYAVEAFEREAVDYLVKSGETGDKRAIAANHSSFKETTSIITGTLGRPDANNHTRTCRLAGQSPYGSLSAMD